MTYSQVQNYERAVRAGFSGTLEEYQREVKQYQKAWGRKRQRVNGHLVWYDECVECGSRAKPHYLNGYCRKCYEKTRRAYKLAHYHAHHPGRNEIQEQKTEIRNQAG